MKRVKLILCIIMSIAIMTACGSDGDDRSYGNLVTVERIDDGSDEETETEPEEAQDPQAEPDTKEEGSPAPETGNSANAPAGNTSAGNAGREDIKAADKKAAESKGGDEPMKAAYASVLKGIYSRQQFPDGKDYGFDSSLNISDNKFAVCDIDGDGRDELIILYTTTYYGGMVGIVYDYDKSAGTVREELLEFPAMTFYDNGAVKVESSHNHGLAGDISSDEFWPYTLYQYDRESDAYKEAGSVDAWSKAFAEKDSKGNSFPDDIDADGDGLVYLIPLKDKPVDKEEYIRWWNNYIGDAKELTISFKDLTEANIAETGIGNGETVKYREPSFYGTWKVKDHQAADVSALSEDEIKDFLGYSVTYQEDAVYQNGKDMKAADCGYEYAQYTQEELVQSFCANLGEWWNEKETVTRVVVTSEESFFGGQFFIADDETLWIYYEGVFFLARKDQP